MIDQPIDNIIFFYGIKIKQIAHSINDIDSKITYVEGIPNDFQDYISGDKTNNLFIFDDLMEEAVNHKGLTNLFTIEIHHLNISVIILLQDMFYSGAERKTLFRNADYLILFITPLDKSSVFAISHKIMPKNVTTFIKIYELATKPMFGHLLGDGHRLTPGAAWLRTDIFNQYQKVFEPVIWM